MTRLSARGPERRRGGTLPSGHSRGGDVSGDWGCASFFTYHEGADVFAVSPYPSTIQIMLLKTDIPRETSQVRAIEVRVSWKIYAWIYSEWKRRRRSRIFHFSFYENFRE